MLFSLTFVFVITFFNTSWCLSFEFVFGGKTLQGSAFFYRFLVCFIYFHRVLYGVNAIVETWL
jgi:hypothetical protein